jgi:hypothetical protein
MQRAIPKTAIQFLANTPNRVLVKPVPPLFKTKNLPEGLCWYAAIEHLADTQDNAKAHTALNKFAENVADLEKKRFFASHSANPKHLQKVSQYAAEMISNTLKSEFNYSNEKTASTLQKTLLDAQARQVPGVELVYLSKEKPQITDKNKEYLLHSICLKELYKGLKLQENKWAPENSFDDLMKQLKQSGPMMVAGHFGPAYYSAESTSKTSVGGRKIYQFPKGSIGLEKSEKQNLVYYVDPSEQFRTATLDPKIYVMSENLFRSNLYNICSDSQPDVKGRNMPLITNPPFALTAADYGKLQQQFMKQQLDKRNELLKQSKTNIYSYCDYSSLQNLSLVAKRFTRDCSAPVKEVNEKIEKEFTHSLRKL